MERVKNNYKVFPAYAGVILNISVINILIISIPRIRGGDPVGIVPFKMW